MSITVGVFLLVLELILFCIYCYKRNSQLENLSNLINPSEIKLIVSKYKFESNVLVLIWLLVIVAGAVIGFVFNKYPSIPTGFFFLSVIVFIILLFTPYAHASRHLKRVKHGDDKIEQLKQIVGIKYKTIIILYLIPLLIAVVTLVFMAIKVKYYYIISIVAFANVILSVICNRKMMYSPRLKFWTIFCLVSSSMNNLILLYLILSAANLIVYNQYLTILSIFLAVILTSFTLLFALIPTDLENRVEYYKDNDTTSNKIFYNDPNRKEIFIQKNNGNIAINIAQPKGKVCIFVILTLLIALLVSLPIYLIISDFYTPDLQIKGDTVYINDLDYSTNFQISDIQTISLSKNVPSNFKLNGSGNSYYARGLYKITDNNQNAHIYIFKESKPYIIIRLKTCYVIYNKPSKNDTLRSYAILENLRNKQD